MNLAAYGQSLTEKMGYPPDTRLLIIHADDAAVSHSTNQAVMDAFERDDISSTAIMVPCPWFPEMADYARRHPEYDYGLHLTFTSEWHGYKWGGVAPASQIGSLLNEQGYFYSTYEEARKHADPQEVEIELRAQIEKALEAGIKPSHFDTHMNTIYASVDLLRIYIKLGDEYKVPVLIIGNQPEFPDSLMIPEVKAYPRINIYSPETRVEPENWKAEYIRYIEELEPGISEIIVHLAYDNEETRAMTRKHDYYDAAWRQRDVEVMQSKEFAEAIRTHKVKIITWRDIQKVMYPDTKTHKVPSE